MSAFLNPHKIDRGCAPSAVSPTRKLPESETWEKPETGIRTNATFKIKVFIEDADAAKVPFDCLKNALTHTLHGTLGIKINPVPQTKYASKVEEQVL